MKATPVSLNQQPIPAERYRSTEKTYYQPRHEIHPRNGNTGPLEFKDSQENGLRRLDPTDFVMGFSQINDLEPTPLEKGVPLDQDRMGSSGGKLIHERKFG
jgi:hypothetical protein